MSEGTVAPLPAQTAEVRELLIDLGRRYHSAGWLFGTSGNLSARVRSERGEELILITASGRHKGRLKPDDFVALDLAGAVVAAGADACASAESSLHLALYRRVPAAQVVLHVHTVASTLLAADIPPLRAGTPAHAVFGDLEMIKGFELWQPDATAALPVFDNHARVPAIADDVDRYYATPRDVPAFVIRGHGLTAWGTSAFDADRHLEVAEFLARVAVARRPLGTLL